MFETLRKNKKMKNFASIVTYMFLCMCYGVLRTHVFEVIKILQNMKLNCSLAHLKRTLARFQVGAAHCYGFICGMHMIWARDTSMCLNVYY